MHEVGGYGFGRPDEGVALSRLLNSSKSILPLLGFPSDLKAAFTSCVVRPCG